MSYRIEAIELYVRETPPGRMAFSLGKKRDKQAVRLTNPLGHVRLVLSDDRGRTTFGCAADRLSVRWLDKRAGRTRGKKLRELVSLIGKARDLYLASPRFETPFALWRKLHPQIMAAGKAAGQEELTSSFASALFERAVLDGVSRIEGKSFFEMIKQDRIGFRPEQVHGELKGLKFPGLIRKQPATEFFIRHTVGSSDPLTADDLPKEQRVNDGLPETLEEYIRTDGISHFKIKISGDPKRDHERLKAIWAIIPPTPDTVLTLDANEAYSDIEQFARFVRNLERESIGLFQHIAYIEQPLPRKLTFSRTAAKTIRRIGETKPVIIDEADGTIDTFKRAHKLGYAGTSHKNCKGIFKSLLNHALVVHFALEGDITLMSGEDLQNLPIVPLHQDFVTLSVLGLEDCERNGHHYNYGLSLLSEQDKASAAKHHRDMYVKRGDEWFLNVRDGRVGCASLQCRGFGVRDEPDWKSMTEMRRWVQQRFPA